MMQICDRVTYLQFAKGDGGDQQHALYALRCVQTGRRDAPRRAARCDAARHRPNDNKLISMSTEKYARSRRVWIR